ncbi:hypothetical protein QAD02_019686 [Eretmocerus hayati]|uniref:Uncharacterized protein n=1 Tax=Eretmocerus hayati TaxID=131215 RepID=A0ACC2PKV1_9HYME|nr:hypothetical protein QAD02_019686 [Eretmocerus hayati]
MLHLCMNIHRYDTSLLRNQITKRHFFRWLIVIFNGPDERRIQQVGPNRACAEWLLKNGASVRWKGSSEYLTDYNLLPKDDFTHKIQSVDATGAAIHHIGFQNFSGCEDVEEVKLVQCPYIENAAMPALLILKDTLKKLEVIECRNVTDEGLLELKNLRNLESLKLGGDMPYLKDKSNLLSQLSHALPNCKISYDE